MCALLPLVLTVPITVVVATTVPFLYSWLWDERMKAQQPLVVSRDFPQLVDVHNQLVEQKQREQFARAETKRLSAVLPSPTLAKDYASQSIVTDAMDDEDETARVAMRKANLVV